MWSIRAEKHQDMTRLVENLAEMSALSSGEDTQKEKYIVIKVKLSFLILG